MTACWQVSVLLGCLDSLLRHDNDIHSHFLATFPDFPVCPASMLLFVEYSACLSSLVIVLLTICVYKLVSCSHLQLAKFTEDDLKSDANKEVCTMLTCVLFG